MTEKEEERAKADARQPRNCRRGYSRSRISVRFSHYRFWNRKSDERDSEHASRLLKMSRLADLRAWSIR